MVRGICGSVYTTDPSQASRLAVSGGVVGDSDHGQVRGPVSAALKSRGHPDSWGDGNSIQLREPSDNLDKDLQPLQDDVNAILYFVENDPNAERDWDKFGRRIARLKE